MSWTIDTGTVGAVGVAPADLKAFLEADQAYTEKAAVDAAGAAALRTAGAPPTDQAKLLEYHDKVTKLVADAKASTQAYIDACKSQKAAAIKAACDLAAAYTGNVCVTICGHTDPNHPSTVDARITVSVDSAPHVEV